MSKLLPLAAKLWPIVAGVCGAIYFVSLGDYAHAWTVLGLGGAATATSQYLHVTEPPR